MGELSLLDHIWDHAAQESNRPALRVADRSLSYGELVAAATRVAERLRNRGIGAEDVVATVLPRSGNTVIAMLGIWMSGAAYAPADPGWPRRRLDLVLDAASAHITLDPDGTAGDVAIPCEPALRVTATTRADRTRPALRDGDARALAYVIHTSGSTGTPNAVGVEYGALDNYGRYLRNIVRDTAGLSDGDISVLLSANPTFDASLRPVLLLAARATLVVAAELADGSWSDHIDTIRDSGVTILSGVPSWYSGLLGAGFDLSASKVRLSFVGGEAVPNGVVRQLKADNRTVVVQYGPTETTVAATGTVLAGDDFTEPPIGDGIPGARVGLYHEHDLRPVPEGEPGELYVSGVGVARGYLRNPRLTAERFVPDPFGVPGSRMFRTGDIARRLPGGGYAFLGRRDDQVKISGRRIELGEVSSVANRHPAVAQSVAFVHEDGRHPVLAACYVAAPDANAGDLDDRLREHLVRELPDYLVPSVIRRIDALPMTDHGKADVAALVAFVRQGHGVGQTEAAEDQPVDDAPDEVARRLLEIVGETVDRPCTLDDDFFQMGGSLDALDVLARIREEFGVRVRLRDFFERRTIRALYDTIKGAR